MVLSKQATNAHHNTQEINKKHVYCQKTGTCVSTVVPPNTTLNAAIKTTQTFQVPSSNALLKQDCVVYVSSEFADCCLFVACKMQAFDS